MEGSIPGSRGARIGGDSHHATAFFVSDTEHGEIKERSGKMIKLTDRCRGWTRGGAAVQLRMGQRCRQSPGSAWAGEVAPHKQVEGGLGCLFCFWERRWHPRARRRRWPSGRQTAAEKSCSGSGRVRGQGEEKGGGLRVGHSLVSPELTKCGGGIGGSGELIRRPGGTILFRVGGEMERGAWGTYRCRRGFALLPVTHELKGLHGA